MWLEHFFSVEVGEMTHAILMMATTALAIIIFVGLAIYVITSQPRRSSSAETSRASVVFPPPERPVSQTTKPGGGDCKEPCIGGELIGTARESLFEMKRRSVERLADRYRW